ncbi:MAG TPA: carbamoyltransferase HypF [Solirubrobacteraceae bacterium]|jgi:hydrogenase maturation protein HypF|nr:carbamoyltransferase HypF [Solirubrobacteraceae bacterium]
MERTALETRRYQIRGIVQGVGFRPFVFRTAERHALGGWIRNDSEGVVLEVQGHPGVLEEFIVEVRTSAPALARIESVALIEQRYEERIVERFEIHVSERSAQASTLVSPDSCVCDECLRELLDPADRRYRYPYINCTNCGPRYSIIRGVPYDRAMTTMAVFPMCERCEREYHDVRDRRFHAQPTACWECGPRVALVDSGAHPPRLPPWQRPSRELPGAAPGRPDPIEATAALLREGAIVAIKGIGGYHLMVDARNEQAVARLRARKHREEKPFAVMSPTLEAVRSYARVGEREAELLRSPQRPIVLVRKKRGNGQGDGQSGGGVGGEWACADRPLAPGIAPGNRSYGAMLAYTPVHHLLFGEGFDVLVATSGNVSDEPIAFRDNDALGRLSGIADAFLIGERDIYTRVDDSIVRVIADEATPIRRARGYTPEPVRAPFQLPPLLAVGPELKSTICLTRGDEMFLSHHIGDLKNEATMRSFEHAIEHLSMLLEVAPGAIAHDMHPGYLSTRFALGQERLPTVAVQHHHAHMAACMCEHGLGEPVVGVIFDGTGYGTDGNIWGGEFLVGDYVGFERAAHLSYFGLPGGDRAVEEPYRVALSLLHEAYGGDFAQLELPVVRERAPEELGVLGRMLQTGVRSPLTSSMGRLFDGVAALIGVRERCRYEAQAAIELEQLVEPGAAGRPFAWELCGPEQGPWRIDPAPMVRELAGEVLRGDRTARELSLRFHCTVIDMVRETCRAIRARTGIARVVLSGGVFQNELLLRGCHGALGAAGFEVHSHRRVPANDGGVALGQAAVAGWGAVR